MQVDKESCIALSLIGAQLFGCQRIARLQLDFGIRNVVYLAQLNETMTEATSVHHQQLVGRREAIHHHSLHRGSSRTCDKHHAGIVRSLGKLLHQPFVLLHGF